MTSVPVPRSLTLRLAAHVQLWPGEWLISGPDGRQTGPWAVERAIRTARGKVNDLPAGFRYHDLRHFYASLLIASGADVRIVQARLRHASAKTTLDTYGHLWPDRDESTRDAVDAVLAMKFQDPADSLRTGEETP
jgi:integrase